MSALDEIEWGIAETRTIEGLDTETERLLDGLARIEVLLAEVVTQLEARQGHQQLGYPSPTAYLMHRGRISAGRARRIVADAHARHKAPGAHRAWCNGRLSTDQARRVFAAAEMVPQAYTTAEETLVAAIEGLSVSATHRTVEYWRQSVEGPEHTVAAEQFDLRGVSLSKTWHGMRRLDGWLTPLAGAALETALDSLLPPPSQDDTRTPRQRRHDALQDLARSHLDHGKTPRRGGEKPHIMVLADLNALNGVAGGVHQTLEGEILDVTTLRMLACDSSISRIVLGPRSEVLDVGRKTRVWSPAQRRAIIARDRHCTAPGCEMSPAWCDIHHQDHWTDGGHTTIDKGALYCRFHHTLHHLAQAKLRNREKP